jgi:hypothetical protein
LTSFFFYAINDRKEAGRVIWVNEKVGIIKERKEKRIILLSLGRLFLVNECVLMN